MPQVWSVPEAFLYLLKSKTCQKLLTIMIKYASIIGINISSASELFSPEGELNNDSRQVFRHKDLKQLKVIKTYELFTYTLSEVIAITNSGLSV